MPLGLTSGRPTPRFPGNQSWLENTALYRRTMDRVRSSPTSNSTVSTDRPGREAEYMCSTPSISERTCSADVVTSCSTSLALAPGKGTKTLAKVTSICGSSSRGVTATAKRPSRKPVRASNGVISESRNLPAMVPEIPRRSPMAHWLPCCSFRSIVAPTGSSATRSFSRNPAST